MALKGASVLSRVDILERGSIVLTLWECPELSPGGALLCCSDPTVSLGVSVKGNQGNSVKNDRRCGAPPERELGGL